MKARLYSIEKMRNNKGMSFQLRVLGSGTLMPTKERKPSSYLLECGPQRLLLDAGQGSLSRLVDLGIDPHSIQTVFASHFHTDHFCDVFPLIHARWVDDIYHSRQTTSPLTLLGPVGLQERWQKWREISWCEPNEAYDFELLEGARNWERDDLSAELFEVKHVPWFQSLGIKVHFQGKTLMYTGDIGSDHPWDDLLVRASDVDLLLIEAAGIKKSSNHFTVEQALRLKQAAEVKRLLITHVREPYIREQKALIAGVNGVDMVEDGLIIEL